MLNNCFFLQLLCLNFIMKIIILGYFLNINLPYIIIYNIYNNIYDIYLCPLWDQKKSSFFHFKAGFVEIHRLRNTCLRTAKYSKAKVCCVGGNFKICPPFLFLHCPARNGLLLELSCGTQVYSYLFYSNKLIILSLYVSFLKFWEISSNMHKK